MVLDEAAHIAPLPELDGLAATCASHGIQIVTVWQDLAQVRGRYGARAPTVLNNHRAKLFLPGIADPDTLEYASRLIGDEDAPHPSVTRDPTGRRSTTSTTAPRRLLPPEALRCLPRGEGSPGLRDPAPGPAAAPALVEDDAAAPPAPVRSVHLTVEPPGLPHPNPPCPARQAFRSVAQGLQRKGRNMTTGEVRMLIDGELVEASSGKRFDNINPATEEVLGEVADASAEDMQRAIDSSRRAFDETDWSTNHALRTRCLEQLQAALEAEREAFREEIVAEVGSPRMMTFAAQVDWPIDEALGWPTKMIDEFQWERSLPNSEMMGMKSRRGVIKEPMGVIGAIVPWNYPLEVTLNKLGPILATGNTMVLKPAPDTPWNATRLGRLIAEKTDIPAGVVNIVTSSDHLVGEELTLSPKVDLISFTGSTATGKRIMEKGAATLKRVFLELGGKSADDRAGRRRLRSTVPMASMVCVHAGQGCAMQSRLLLPRSRYDEGVELVTAGMAAVPYGDPTSDEVLMGPLVSAKQRDRVLGYIAKGKRKAPSSSSAAAARPTRPRDGSSSRHCSSTWTTP